MNFPYVRFPGKFGCMKALGFSAIACVMLLLLEQLAGQSQRRSLLDDDPNVVQLDTVLDKPLMLTVVKQAPVFSDYEGRHRLGFLRANQTVQVEAITDKAYRVRGRGTRDGIAGWVPPWAFSSTEPEFVEQLKNLYQREMTVRELIAAGHVAIGMTLNEVKRCKGEPGKTSVRRTEDGEVGRWEYVEYEDVKHYVTHIDPVSRRPFRTLSHITREETGKLAVEFENGIVTAIEENRDDQAGNVRIIVPPLVFRW